MKAIFRISIVLLAASLALVGCGKSDNGGAAGVPATLDLPKFQQAFPSPSPEQQTNIEKVIQGVRYRLYPDALAALDKLASDPALTEAQSKAVKDLIQGIKQTMASAAPPQPQ